MIITLITDQFYQNNHGTSVSAQRLYNGLVQKGNTVKVVAIDNGNNTDYALHEKSYGKCIDKIVNSQGMQFAKFDKEVIKSAIEGSDIVHIYMPFKLGIKSAKLCHEMNVPCTAAFHLVPENITSTIHLNKSKLVNNLIWKSWKHKLYKDIAHIHCPSNMVANQLNRHKYNSNLHVISNGYDEEFIFKPEEKPEFLKDKFVLVALGRFSREKRFDLLIKAVKKSKYKDKIVVIFGGKGPLKSKIMKMSKKLPNAPIFLGRYNHSQQISILNFADLYIHPADVEVEGMTCLEAIACGCVPIVSDNPKSATKQFIVSDQSVFEHGKYKSLAQKIDYWLGNPEELKSQKNIIAEHAKSFSIDRSIDLYMEMFNEAIKEKNN